MFVVPALGNAWVIGVCVQTDAEGSWSVTDFDLYLAFVTSMMVESCLLSAWLVFGGTQVVLRGAVVAASVAILSFEFQKLLGTDSQLVRPDILAAFVVAALLVPRLGGWRVVKLPANVTPESSGRTRQFSLRQLLMTTCLVAVACSVFRYLSRTQSLPEIFLINLVLDISLTVLSLYATLVCAKPVRGVLLVVVLYVAISAALAVGCSWYQDAPYDSLMTDFNIRSMLLELTLALLPLFILRKCGYRLTAQSTSPPPVDD